MEGILRRQIIVFLTAGRAGLASLLGVMWLIGGFDNSGGLMLLYMTTPITVMFLSLALKYAGDHRYLPAGYRSESGYDRMVRAVTFSVCGLQPLFVLLQGLFFLLPSDVFFFAVFLIEIATGGYAGYMLSDIFSDVVKEDTKDPHKKSSGRE